MHLDEKIDSVGPFLIGTPSSSLGNRYRMAFNAFLEVDILFDGGRPFFYSVEEVVEWTESGRSLNRLVTKKNFDLTKIPKIPVEFQEFENLHGWKWGAVLLDVNNGDNVDSICFDGFAPSYDTMKLHPEFDDTLITPELVQRFNEFCRWVRNTDIAFYYRVSY